jgi:uncharacterized membrane protein YagU involved in acid resistance
MRKGHEANVWKGAVAGLAGGLAASWVMNEFQAGLSKATQDHGGSEDATMKAAGSIAKTVLGRELSHGEKAQAGPFVHYAFGGLMGALYGAAVEVAPKAQAARGLSFGTALWFGADEVGVPAAGLSGPPMESPPSVHASALASHLVYGFTVDLVRRAVRAVL